MRAFSILLFRFPVYCRVADSRCVFSFVQLNTMRNDVHDSDKDAVPGEDEPGASSQAEEKRQNSGDETESNPDPDTPPTYDL